jgi:hypothetical protein
LDLIAAGTCPAIAAFALGVDVLDVGGVDVLVDELLLPHPAIASTASTGAPIRATSLLI